MKVTLADLRNAAVEMSLFRPTTLGRAVARLGFVQADPIRSPARAQDLILRHRVTGYRAGDLDRGYRRLGLEEDYLYAYGFMPRSTWELLHPRAGRALTAVEEKVLSMVMTRRRLHPRELEAEMGTERERNAWGGQSKATTRALERLHYLGLIRVVGRERGVKVYAGAVMTHEVPEAGERLRRLALLIAGILSPVPERSLRATLRHLGRAAPQLEGRKGVVTELLQRGELEWAEVEGARYVWPAGWMRRRSRPPAEVRFLAPFDPVVWDRRRFEQMWGWPYRFEAYVPAAKRTRGYYALPLLWGAEVVGWVNVTGRAVEAGYVRGRPPAGAEYREAFAAEVERMRLFLAMRRDEAD